MEEFLNAVDSPWKALVAVALIGGSCFVVWCIVRFLNSLSSRVDELADMPWTFSDMKIEVTHAQARALAAEVMELLERYRRPAGDHDVAEGVERAVFQFQMLPDEVDP